MNMIRMVTENPTPSSFSLLLFTYVRNDTENIFFVLQDDPHSNMKHLFQNVFTLVQRKILRMDMTDKCLFKN